MTLSVGDKLGPYEILGALGAGGMGEVWKARDTRLGRVVAIKRLKGQHSARFAQEARAIASLNHPHICQIHDVGPGYLVLEYIEGKPLAGPLPQEEALRLAIEIASALEEAHARGILHRDLKPANILVNAKRTAKLLDFGLAKMVTGNPPEATQTIEGTVLGTPAYMAPEQVQAKPLDERSDIFSFGAVLYEMLAGRRAFSASSTAEVFGAVLRDEPAPLEAPAAIQQIVRRCLAKDPSERFQSMAEVRAALDRVSHAGDSLRIELLGGFRIARNGQPAGALATARVQSLIAYLILHPGAALSRQQLASLFWADSEESQARTNLRQLLHHLRTALPESAAYLDVDHQTLSWHPDHRFSSDVTEFEQSAGGGALETAARLYRGDLLPGFYDEWLEPERERLSRLYESVLDRLAVAAAEGGDVVSAVGWAELRLARDPLREASYQTLMRLYARQGDRAAALRIYQRCADVLRKELDVEPGPATRRARDEAMELPPAAAAMAPPAPTVHAPQLGPLIGRQAECAQLEDLWRRAASGQPSLVLLTGEAGIGKTRLLEEILHSAAGAGASIARTSFYAGERALAYSAPADWLRSPVFRAHVEELPAVQRAQLARVLPEMLLEEPQLGPQPPFTEAAEKRRFFETLARAVLKPAGPVLLAIDDLQWCDPESIEWLHYLLRFDPGARLLVVATVRTDDAPADRLILRERSAEIAVRALNEKDTQELAAQVAGRDISRSAGGSLFEKTRGNPLFVVETVRSGWVGGDDIPAKVHAVISGRLSRLSESAQDMARVAAAIGRPFTVEFAAAVMGLPEDAAIQSVDELWKHRVLEEEGGGTFDFTHGCLRDVAYAAIGPARQRQLHRRVAETLEGSEAAEPDALCGQLANHYERAGLAARAIPHYRRAAHVLRRRFAEQEAIEYLSKALRLLESLPPSTDRDQLEVELLVALGSALSATQGYASEEAGKVYARARMLCESSPNTPGYFAVLAGSWLFHVVRAEVSIAQQIAERYTALAGGDADPMLLASGRFCLGSTAWHLGSIRAAREHLETSSRIAGQGARPVFELGPELAIFRQSYLAHVLWLMGEAEDAIELAGQTVARAESISHPFSLAIALAYAAMLHQFRAEPELARDRAEEAATVCRRYGFRYYLSWAPIIAGWARAQLGEQEGGLADMLRGFKDLRATGAGLRAPYYLGLIAQVCGSCGDANAGVGYLQEAAALAESSGEKWIQPELQRIQGDLLRQIGEPSQAEMCYQNALRLARQMEARAWELRVEASLQQPMPA